MKTIVIIALSVALCFVLVYVTITTWRENRKLKKLIEEQERDNAAKNEVKEQMETGHNNADFVASLNILSQLKKNK